MDLGISLFGREISNFNKIREDSFKKGKRLKEKNIFYHLKEIKQFFCNFPHTDGFYEFKDQSIQIDYFLQIPISERCIVLDASMDFDLIKRYFPPNSKFKEVEIKGQFSPLIDIYQLKVELRIDPKGRPYRTNAYPISSLVNSKDKDHIISRSSIHRLSKIVNDLANKFQNPLIIVQKKYGTLEFFRDRCTNKNAKFIYYHAERGSNEYLDCDAVILVGTPYLNDEQYSKMVNILSFNMDRLRNQLIQDEMNQIMHRIWGFIRETKCDIILLTSYPIFPEGVKVNYLTEDELLHTFGLRTKHDKKDEQIKSLMTWRLFYVDAMGKTELLKEVHGDKTRKKILLEELIKEEIIEIYETTVGVKKKRKLMVSLNPTEKERLKHLSVRISFIYNPFFEEAFKNVGKSIPPRDVHDVESVS